MFLMRWKFCCFRYISSLRCVSGDGNRGSSTTGGSTGLLRGIRSRGGGGGGGGGGGSPGSGSPRGASPRVVSPRLGNRGGGTEGVPVPPSNGHHHLNGHGHGHHHHHHQTTTGTRHNRHHKLTVSKHCNEHRHHLHHHRHHPHHRFHRGMNMGQKISGEINIQHFLIFPLQLLGMWFFMIKYFYRRGVFILSFVNLTSDL